MICDIQNRDRALDYLCDEWLYETMNRSFTFNLDKELKPHTIPFRLLICTRCNLKIEFNLSSVPVVVCSRCGCDKIDKLTAAELVIQGNAVLWMKDW